MDEFEKRSADDGEKTTDSASVQNMHTQLKALVDDAAQILVNELGLNK